MDRMLERIVFRFFFFEQTVKTITAIYYDHFTGSHFSYNDLLIYAKRCGPRLIITLSLINLKKDMILVNQELIGIGEFYSLIIFIIKYKYKSKSKYKSNYKSKSK